MPEGDALHRAAARLQPLVGHVVAAEAHHGRSRALGVAEALDGLRLERVEAVGKNLLLTFEGGLVLRSHLRMKGRWRVQREGRPIVGQPWLVLRGGGWEAVQSNGPVLQLRRGHDDRVARLGPDVMLDPPDLDGMVTRLRGTDQSREVGDAVLDQRLVSGIGNKWKAEGLFLAGVSPWARLGDLGDGDLRRILDETSRAMREGRRGRLVYRRAGRPCTRCETRIQSWPQGDAARTAYWCPDCQPLPEAAPARPSRPSEAGTGPVSA
jgi:endonuclease VIII